MGANAHACPAGLRLHELVQQPRRQTFPSGPASAFAHIGNGTNMVIVDPQHDLVIVLRWIERNATDEVLKRVIGAIERKG